MCRDFAMRWLRLLLLLLVLPLQCVCAERAAVDLSGRDQRALRARHRRRGAGHRLWRAGTDQELSGRRFRRARHAAGRGWSRCAARPLQMAAAAITAALAAGYIREPSVAVEIETYRPFFIQGAVKTGGQFPYVYGMTVRAAICTAGGFADTADRTKAIVYRRQGTGDGQERRRPRFPDLPRRHDRDFGTLALADGGSLRCASCRFCVRRSVDCSVTSTT